MDCMVTRAEKCPESYVRIRGDLAQPPWDTSRGR